MEFLADVAVDQFRVRFEVLEGVLAEGGEEVPVEGLPVAVEGGLFEAAPGEVLCLPALGESGEGEWLGFAVALALDVNQPAAELFLGAGSVPCGFFAQGFENAPPGASW